MAEQTPRLTSRMYNERDGWNQEAVRRELRMQWGTDADTNAANVRKAVERGGEALVRYLEDTGAGDNPVVINLLALMGDEPDLLDVSKGQARINAIMDDPSHK